MTRAFDEYRDTALWSAHEETIAELVGTHEIKVETAREYVIGYVCRELAAKRVVAAAAMPRPS